jgi:LysR family transcriptional regulator, transcriptional activator of the cysJI operon
MDLISLRLFCDLVESRSFQRAAERSYISQPAASRRIRDLERNYAQVLLERGKGKGRIEPTEAGRLLYEGAKVLLNEADELDARIRGLSEEVAGTVRVATVYSVGLHSMPGRLKPFLAAHPQVNVHLEYSQTGKVYQDVLAGAVDVGIVACPMPRLGIEVLPFSEEEMVLICAPEHILAWRMDVRLKELSGKPFIAFQDNIPTRKLTDERLREAGVEVNIVTAVDNIETIKNLVEIGTGIALVPETTVRQEKREGTLAVVPLHPNDAFKRPAGILLKSGRTRRAAVRAFVEAMRP